MNRRLRAHRSKMSTSSPLTFEALEARRLMAFDLTVLDANTESNALKTLSTPVQLGTAAIFYASDSQNGLALWKSNGTSAGTVMLKDVDLGATDVPELPLANAGNVVYFTAAANASELGLWKTDGTIAGTSLVKNLGSQSPTNAPGAMRTAGNTLYFRSQNQLWQSNGTSAGTFVAYDENPLSMINIGSTLYFKAHAAGGETLFKRSGNTTSVAFSGGQFQSNISNLTDVGGSLYFTAKQSIATSLLRYSGTGNGSQIVSALSTAANPTIDMENVSGTLFLKVGNSLKKLNAASELEVVRDDLLAVHNLINVSGKLFFNASTVANGEELWKSDGTAAGTTMVRDIQQGSDSSNNKNLINVNGTLYFTNYSTGVLSLWKSNGTAVGTRRVEELTNWGSPEHFANIAGTLFFAADQNYLEGIMWRSNGTAAGTSPLKEVQTLSANASQLTPVGDKLFFTALENDFATELWVTDGTQDGLVNLNINTSGGSEPSYLVNVSGTLYFTATTSTTGTELWKSDGTPEGTTIVSDQRRGIASSFPRDLINVNGLLYFTADSTSSGRELWRLERAGPVLVRDIRSGTASSNIANIVNIGSRLYFTATNGTNGVELWTSNGAANTTVMVRDIAPGVTSSNPQSLTVVGTTLYFQANDGVNGAELWKSTGTSASTVIVRNIVSGAGSSSPSNMTNVNGLLYFSANDGLSGRELFRSNGTSLGTSRVADISTGRGSSNPSELTNVMGSLYFSATDATGDRELWRVVGNTAIQAQNLSATGSSNPNQLRNVNGPGNGNPAWIVSFRQGLAFAATSSLFGREAFFYDPLSGSSDDDYFKVVQAQWNGIDVVNVYAGASQLDSQLVARYAPSSSLHFDGKEGNDTVAVNGTDISVDQAGIHWPAGALVAHNFETQQLVATSEPSVFRFDTDTPLGNFIVSNLTPSNAPTLDFSLSSLPISLDLQINSQQLVNENLNLTLPQAADIRRVLGGTGDDSIFGNGLLNELSGGAGNDLLVGNGGDDVLSGEEGNDILRGLSGNDALTGGNGNDVYTFDDATVPEADNIVESSGAGIDRIDFQTATSSVIFSLALTTAQPAQANRTIQLSAGDAIEDLIGGQANDTLLGNDLNNTLNGKQGDDNLRGLLGNDIYAFDDLTSATELDTVTELSAAGLDSLDFSAVTTNVVLDLALTSIQSVHGNRSLKLSSATTFENAVGGSSDDTLSGNGLANVLIGNAGHDILKGFGKRDLLIGGLGLDELFGGSDDDVLIPSSTVHDLVFQNLNELCLEWSSAASYAQRILSLKNGVGPGGVALKPTIDVLDDSGALDQLSGETHLDWFFKDATDAILDLNGEIIEEL